MGLFKSDAGLGFFFEIASPRLRQFAYWFEKSGLGRCEVRRRLGEAYDQLLVVTFYKIFFLN